MARLMGLVDAQAANGIAARVTPGEVYLPQPGPADPHAQAGRRQANGWGSTTRSPSEPAAIGLTSTVLHDLGRAVWPRGTDPDAAEELTLRETCSCRFWWNAGRPASVARAVGAAPQARSTRISWRGQVLSVAALVRSYLA